MLSSSCFIFWELPREARSFSSCALSCCSSSRAVLQASSASRTRSPVPEPMLSSRRSLITSCSRRLRFMAFTFTCISRSLRNVRLLSTVCSPSSTLWRRSSAIRRSSVSAEVRSSRSSGVPAIRLSPALQYTSTMRLVMGELMIISNAGTTRPVPPMEVSMVPRVTSATVMALRCTLGTVKRNAAPMAHVRGIITHSERSHFRMASRRCCCFGISLSIVKVMLRPKYMAHSVPKMQNIANQRALTF